MLQQEEVVELVQEEITSEILQQTFCLFEKILQNIMQKMEEELEMLTDQSTSMQSLIQINQ